MPMLASRDLGASSAQRGQPRCRFELKTQFPDQVESDSQRFVSYRVHQTTGLFQQEVECIPSAEFHPHRYSPAGWLSAFRFEHVIHGGC